MSNSSIVSFDPDNKKHLQTVQETLSKAADEARKSVKQIAKELNISTGLATDIWYIRTRSRWSEAYEAAYIAAVKDGHNLNVMENETENLRKLGYLK